MSCGTIRNGQRCGGGAAALTFTSPDGTIAISQIDDVVELELAGGPVEVTSPLGTIDVAQLGNAIELELVGGAVEVTSPDGSIAVDQVGNAIGLRVVSTPQLVDESGQTTDGVTPLLFTLGTLANEGDSLAINLNVIGTSDDGVDLRSQVIVGVSAVRRGGSISVSPAMFVNAGGTDGGGGGFVIDPFDVSGNDVRLALLGLAATVVNWHVTGNVTFSPGA